jgi:hypothetical protein
MRNTYNVCALQMTSKRISIFVKLSSDTSQISVTDVTLLKVTVRSCVYIEMYESGIFVILLSVNTPCINLLYFKSLQVAASGLSSSVLRVT